MSQFVKKASSKIEKLSDEEILRIIASQNTELKIRNTILDNSFEGCLVVSSSLTVLYMNKIVSSLIPVSKRKSYSGVLVSKIVLNSELLDFITSFVKTKTPVANEYFEIEDPSIGQKSISCFANRLNDIGGYLFVFRDITAFNRFKEEFRKNESLAAMTTMAAGVAHEIKNPLASISIYLQLLDRVLEKNGSVTREEAHKYLDVVSEEVDRINSIAVDFLFAVKPMKVDLKSCSINDIARKTIKVVQAELEDNNIVLEERLATSLPKVFADSSLIEQSILNLVKNAMQAIPKNKSGATITITSYLEGDMVKLSVSDNGCGMSEDQMSKIFEPYYTTKSSGTGLGLTVLYKIMKQHGGDVSVRSVLGEGSEFTIQIPVPQNERYRIGMVNTEAIINE